MCCSEYKNSLHEYASVSLSELEYHAIARHLKTCDKCRNEVEEIKEMKAFLKFDFLENVMPPMDLKSGIMASINLKRYKKVYKNTLGELANWGMSLVAAGLILLFINTAPTLILGVLGVANAFEHSVLQSIFGGNFYWSIKRRIIPLALVLAGFYILMKTKKTAREEKISESSMEE